MGDTQNLPTLQDKRLTYMSKITRRTRKLTQIENDMLSRKNDVYSKCLGKEKQNLNYRTWQRAKPFRESLLQARSIQKCMKKHKICDCFINSPEYNYGMYGGLRLRSLRHEIEQTIKEAHPKIRRQRNVQKLLADGKEDGRLVDYDKVQKTLDNIINRQYQTNLFGLTWSPTGYDFKGNNTGLRLPPLKMSREKSREFRRPKSGGDQNRHKTFMIEPSTTRF